jgi:hypothetical protein
MAGTGLSDILLEAGLIGSGSVTDVMTGTHYRLVNETTKYVQLKGLFIKPVNM